MIKRSTSAEVNRLLADALGDDGVARESAVARLVIAGPRVVDRVVAALGRGPSPLQTIALLQVLEGIGDPRALAAVEACLDSPTDDVAVGAVAATRPLLRSGHAPAADRALERLTSVALSRDRADQVRAAALDAIHDLGPEIVEPLRRALKDDPSPGLRRLAGWPDLARPASAAATEEPPDLESVAAALPGDPDAVRQLVAATGRAVPLSVLHRLVAAIREREDLATEPLVRQRWTGARGAVHQVLAERGSRVALYDLRETLERRPDDVPVAMLVALRAVGDRTCLEPLADAAARAADPWLRTQLTDAFRTILRRERLTRRHALLKRIEAKHPELFASA